MAKIFFDEKGSPYISGSIGAITFCLWNGIRVVKQKRVCGKEKNSPEFILSKCMTKEIAEIWNSLSKEEKLFFKELAKKRKKGGGYTEFFAPIKRNFSEFKKEGEILWENLSEEEKFNFAEEGVLVDAIYYKGESLSLIKERWSKNSYDVRRKTVLEKLRENPLIGKNRFLAVFFREKLISAVPT